MNIEIKKSIKPVKYKTAIDFLETRLINISKNMQRELIWFLEHEEVYTAGTSYNDNEVLDKNINLVKTNRGGKITYHGPGQIVCYFVLDLKKRKKDIRKLISLIEKTIIETLLEFDITSKSDPKNIGIWYTKENRTKKIAAIGVRVSKWIAYHGFAINVNNDLRKYNSIIPCGITNMGVTNLKEIKNQDYKKLVDVVIQKFTKNLKIEDV